MDDNEVQHQQNHDLSRLTQQEREELPYPNAFTKKASKRGTRTTLIASPAWK